MSRVISLTTDFGIRSTYVAQMKAVILSIAREVTLVDVTHEISPQNVEEGSLALEQATKYFPDGSIHIAVIDPGVGTSRRILHIQCGAHHFVLPDNGLITDVAHVVQPSAVHAIDQSDYWNTKVSSTFHGRDIMAPVAAHLAKGVAPELLGTRVQDFMTLSPDSNITTPNGVEAWIKHVDSYGNLITSLEADELPENAQSFHLDSAAHKGQVELDRVATYGQAEPGKLVLLISSDQRAEIAEVNGNAAETLKLNRGEKIRLTWS